jgi:hypothetical protein
LHEFGSFAGVGIYRQEQVLTARAAVYLIGPVFPHSVLHLNPWTLTCL